MNKIRIGILGCGTIGDVHARAIAETDNAQLFAVCDSNEARAKEYADKYGVKAYSSYEAMLLDEEIDAVAICTPSGMHRDQSVAALNAGKHVLLEKPMALTSADAEDICKAEAASGKILSVVFQMRFTDDVQYLRRIISEGKLGKLTFCDLYMKYWRDPSYFTVSPWRGTFLMDGGGALMNQGIHGVDVMHYLCGKPRLIAARAKTLIHKIETEDTAAALVEYESGALGVMEASTSSYPGFDRKVMINGTRGYAVIVDSHLEKLFIDGELLVDKKVDSAAGTASDPTKMSHKNHVLQYKNFPRAILFGDELVSSSADGYAAVKFIEDVYKNSKSFD